MRDLVADVALSLFSRGLRTLLTMAGVLLGLGSLVAISGVAGSMGENVVRSFDRYAASQLVLSASGTAANAVTSADLDRIRALNGVEDAVLACHLGFRNVANASGGESAQFEIIGISSGGLAVLEPRLSGGQLPGAAAEAERLPLAAVGTGVARRLNLGSPDHGTAVTVQGHDLAVVAVVDDVPRLPMLLNQVLVPLPTQQEIWGARCASVDVVVTTRPSWPPSVAGVVRQTLSPQAVDAWTVAVPPSPDALRRGVVSDLSVLYAVMAGLSLIVGVLSIGNTMSVSVLERRGEIGLRRAIGFSARRIFVLFSLEAFTIGFIGGLLGSSVGCMAVIAVAKINGWPIIVSAPLVLATPLLGGVIGFLGGLLPAWSASRVSPATALRA